MTWLELLVSSAACLLAGVAVGSRFWSVRRWRAWRTSRRLWAEHRRTGRRP